MDGNCSLYEVFLLLTIIRVSSVFRDKYLHEQCVLKPRYRLRRFVPSVSMSICWLLPLLQIFRMSTTVIERYR